MGLVRTVAPATTPISVSEVARQCKIPDYLANDTGVQTDLARRIAAAVDRCERVTERGLITQTWQLTLDSFCDEQAERAGTIYFDCRLGMRVIQLPRSPVIYATTADASIAYLDSAGAAQTMTPTTDYQVDAKSEPGRLLPAPGATWPTTESGRLNAVTITFKAGYGAAATDVPSEIRERLLAYVGYVSENRGDVGAAVVKDPVDEEYLDKIFLRFWTGRY